MKIAVGVPGRSYRLEGNRVDKKIPIPAAAAAGMGRPDLPYCLVMVQTTADFGVV